MSNQPYTPFGVSAQIGVPAPDNTSIFFGDASDSSLYYDGTNMIIDPTIVGVGFLFVGDGTTKSDVAAGHLGLGTDWTSFNTGRIIDMQETSTLTSNGLFLTLTHTGSVSACRAMNFTINHSGSATSPSAVGGLFASLHTVDPTGTVTLLGCSATGGSNAANTQGTRVYEGLRGAVTNNGSISGGNVRAASVHGLVVPSFAGAAAVLNWAGLFDDDVQIATDKKLLLEGTSTTKGDSYFVFNSATTDIGLFVDNTNVEIWDNDGIDLLVKYLKYNNISTVSNGIPSEYATIDTTGLTANVGATTMYAVPSSGAGMYRVCTLVVETTAGSLTSTLPNVQILYTDNETGGVITIDATPVLGAAGIGQTGALTANTVGTTSTGVIVINAKASTNIQYQTVNYASNLAGMTYALHIKLEAM